MYVKYKKNLEDNCVMEIAEDPSSRHEGHQWQAWQQQTKSAETAENGCVSLFKQVQLHLLTGGAPVDVRRSVQWPLMIGGKGMKTVEAGMTSPDRRIRWKNYGLSYMAWRSHTTCE